MIPSDGRKEQTRILLNNLAASVDEKALAMDPLEIVRQYPETRDREVVGFIAAALALGRFEKIRDAIGIMLAPMGDSPSQFIRQFNPGQSGSPFHGFTYRFYKERDVSLLISWLGHILRTSGSIEKYFLQGYDKEDPHIGPALSVFVRRIRTLPTRPFYSRLPRHGAGHFLTDPADGSGCKRLCLFLRWMVRREYPDLGLWSFVPPSKLVIPLDTHIFRLSRCLGLTRRATPGWKTALEITRSLKQFNPDDPVRYDFSLCTLGKGQACPPLPDENHCRECGIREVCVHCSGSDTWEEVSSRHDGVFS